MIYTLLSKVIPLYIIIIAGKNSPYPLLAVYDKVGVRIHAFMSCIGEESVSVAAKWIKAARQNVLNIYTSNQAYAKLDFG